ncbi:MAG: hypothetical protein ACRDIL_13250 [Candidatus Limnocylindrales bacterium]
MCGYGRVGRLIGPALERRGFRYVVITEGRDEVDGLRARGIHAVYPRPVPSIRGPHRRDRRRRSTGRGTQRARGIYRPISVIPVIRA